MTDNGMHISMILSRWAKAWFWGGTLAVGLCGLLLGASFQLWFGSTSGWDWALTLFFHMVGVLVLALPLARWADDATKNRLFVSWQTMALQGYMQGNTLLGVWAVAGWAGLALPLAVQEHPLWWGLPVLSALAVGEAYRRLNRALIFLLGVS